MLLQIHWHGMSAVRTAMLSVPTVCGNTTVQWALCLWNQATVMLSHRHSCSDLSKKNRTLSGNMYVRVCVCWVVLLTDCRSNQTGVWFTKYLVIMLNQLTLVTCDMLKFLLWILHKNSNKNESSSVFYLITDYLKTVELLMARFSKVYCKFILW